MRFGADLGGVPAGFPPEEGDPRETADRYRAWLAAIVEHSDDAIVSKDLNGVISSWNAGAQRLFGYDATEAIGRPIQIVIPPDRLDEEPLILSRIRRGERIEQFETIRRRKDGTLVEVSLTVSPVKDSAGRIVGASKIAHDITERRTLERQRNLILSEMNHRIRNTLATVQAIAAQTMRGAPPAERAAFGSRLQSLARAHDLMTIERWNRTSVKEVVARALEVFNDEHRERFTVEGPAEPPLEAGRAMMLAMALHELATNATKYGALSNAEGRVLIDWRPESSSRGERLRFRWREQGGPPVTPPVRHGFGTRLIEIGGGSVAFEPGGIVCTLDMAT
jgi:PAS domain S-box-containing protein